MKVLNKNAKLKDKYVIQSLIRQSDLAFYGFFNNSSIKNQRLKIVTSIQFNMLIKSTEEKIIKGLKEKRDFLIFLCNDFVDLIKLNTIGRKLIEKKRLNRVRYT